MQNKENEKGRPLWRDLPGWANFAQLAVKLLHWVQQHCAGWEQHTPDWWHEVLAALHDWL